MNTYVIKREIFFKILLICICFIIFFLHQYYNSCGTWINKYITQTLVKYYYIFCKYNYRESWIYGIFIVSAISWLTFETCHKLGLDWNFPRFWSRSIIPDFPLLFTYYSCVSFFLFITLAVPMPEVSCVGYLVPNNSCKWSVNYILFSISFALPKDIFEDHTILYHIILCHKIYIHVYLIFLQFYNQLALTFQNFMEHKSDGFFRYVRCRLVCIVSCSNHIPYLSSSSLPNSTPLF